MVVLLAFVNNGYRRRIFQADDNDDLNRKYGNRIATDTLAYRMSSSKNANLLDEMKNKKSTKRCAHKVNRSCGSEASSSEGYFHDPICTRLHERQ